MLEGDGFVTVNSILLCLEIHIEAVGVCAWVFCYFLLVLTYLFMKCACFCLSLCLLSFRSFGFRSLLLCLCVCLLVCVHVCVLGRNASEHAHVCSSTRTLSLS